MSDALSNKAPHTEPERATSTENTPEATSTNPQPAPLLADPEFDMRGLAWNPLCDAATPLIGLVIRLRRLDQHEDVPALYRSVSNERFTDADSHRWMARFDADSDWPTPEMRFIAPLPMPSAEVSTPMPLRMVPGTACIQAGWWLVPGQAHTRRAFKQGEIMPDLNAASTDDLVTWQRDLDQTAPEPARYANTHDPAPRAGRWEVESDRLIARDIQLNERLPAHEGRVVRWHWTVSGMRANSGQPCPYPGTWVCEYKPGSQQVIEHGVPMPTVEGERVVWRWMGLEPS